ncbi:MAG: primosomal protein N', partial [Bacteroidales bacterium]|nr:primosomal protein N' [Bacteroidales bacterium]
MDGSGKILFADVILTLHLPSTYCYRVPKNLNEHIRVGQRVAVQFGRKKIYSAVVVRISEEAPTSYSVKYLLDIIDIEPVLTQTQIDFYKWTASYYAAYIGDVLSAALPAAFRLKSESVIELSPSFDGELPPLEENEKEILNSLLKKGKLTLSDLQEKIPSGELIKIVTSLINKDIIITDEELKRQYIPKKETCVRLADEYTENEERLKELFEKMDSKPAYSKQNQVLLTYLSLLQGRKMIKKSELVEKKCSLSSLQTLIKNGVFVKEDVEISRLKSLKITKKVEDILLNDEQQEVYNQIVEQWNDKPVSLLYGVTGSGKTEVFIKLIDRVLKQGQQVLYLIPEIALTAQLVQRLEAYFGNQIGVYNSRYSTLERAEVWNRVKTDDKQKKINLILGSRSSVFLPFSDLGLVVADEEHDASFKQTEPVPHYNGRDAAMYLAKMFKAKTVLASATPSIESYFNALKGKFQLNTLKHRYSKVLPPEIFVADLKEYHRRKEMYGIFSKMLYDEINLCLKNNQQVILFQNRRGYAPQVRCNICGYVPKCPNCDVSLVLHKYSGSMTCHYCGYTADLLSSCPDCSSHSLRTTGIGTERIEEEIATYFPAARFARMDLDSTRTKDSFEKIVNDFSSQNIDILVGTQIVSKGLDFDNVGLVGVIDADALLHYPYF